MNEMDHLIRYNLFTGFLFDTVQTKYCFPKSECAVKQQKKTGGKAASVLSILLLKQFLLRSILTLIGWLCLAGSQIGETAIDE